MHLPQHSPPLRRPLLLALSFLALPAFLLGSQPAPTIHVEGLYGKPFSLEAQKGKVVLLDFWASWCIPCRKSFPFFDSLQAKFGDKGLQVVGLTLEEEFDPISDFLESVPVKFPVVRDRTGRAGEAFGVVAMPTTFLIDREGRIVARFEGGDEKVHAKIEQAVATLVAGGTLPENADVRVSSDLEATGSLRAWERGFLADPIMKLDGDPLTSLLNEHVHSSKEGASGNGGAAGGGCGCN